jgi:hypothetical protein
MRRLSRFKRTVAGFRALKLLILLPFFRGLNSIQKLQSGSDLKPEFEISLTRDL